mmetsp:Transcript_11898/g.13437  ORF Transcript_11898/g.13437 Transcript_11898/m.13437 type:complete len:204 (+) Transcript_11898:261-872(+)
MNYYTKNSGNTSNLPNAQRIPKYYNTKSITDLNNTYNITTSNGFSDDSYFTTLNRVDEKPYVKKSVSHPLTYALAPKVKNSTSQLPLCSKTDLNISIKLDPKSLSMRKSKKSSKANYIKHSYLNCNKSIEVLSNPFGRSVKMIPSIKISNYSKEDLPTEESIIINASEIKYRNLKLEEEQSLDMKVKACSLPLSKIRLEMVTK